MTVFVYIYSAIGQCCVPVVAYRVPKGHAWFGEIAIPMVGGW